jgi:hypothetical protein
MASVPYRAVGRHRGTAPTELMRMYKIDRWLTVAGVYHRTIPVWQACVKRRRLWKMLTNSPFLSPYTAHR